MIFYDGHDSHFDDRAMNIICRHHIQYFILKAGDYVNGQPNNNGPSMKLKNVYGNERMKWMRKYGTLKFTPTHKNSVLVETWESFKISSTTTTNKYFKNKHLLPLSLSDIDTNHQACLVGTQQPKIDKLDEIGRIAK